MKQTKVKRCDVQRQPNLPSLPVDPPETVRRVMHTQCYCLAIAVGISFFYLGKTAYVPLGVATGGVLVTELVLRKVRRDTAAGSYSHSLLLGILIGLALPPSCEWYFVVLAVGAAVGFKHVSGGLGKHVCHPAILGITVLILFFPEQLRVSEQVDYSRSLNALRQFDELTFEGDKPALDLYLLEKQPPLQICLFGDTNGSPGDSCRFVLILIGTYFFYRGYHHWHLLTAFFGAAYLTAGFLPINLGGSGPGETHWYVPLLAQDPFAGFIFMNYQLFNGPLVLVGSIFMADMSSRPVMRSGQVLYGIGAGFLAVALRYHTTLPLAVFPAVLIVSAFTPAVDFLTRPRGWTGRERRKEL